VNGKNSLTKIICLITHSIIAAGYDGFCGKRTLFTEGM